MSNYRFQEPPVRPVFGPLPEGDYYFVVTEADEPYDSKNGNAVLPLKLSIQPEGVVVFANPWARTKKSAIQDGRDQIAEFLLCINKAPKAGEEPDWLKLVGAKGKCRLTTEIAQQGAFKGKEVNKIHWFYTPKAVNPTPAGKQQTFSQGDFQKAQILQSLGDQQVAAANAGNPEPEPDDIPY